MKPALKTCLFSAAAVAWTAGLLVAARGDETRSDRSLASSVCPVVYRLDESPAAHGYHYTFFGNAFFINDQGYLLTVAHVLDTFKNGGQPSMPVTRGAVGPQWISSFAREEERSAEPPGAAIPIRYAVALLKQNGVAYRVAPSAATGAAPSRQ